MRYYVYRHGWNTANQPSQGSPHKVRVAEVDAASADEARTLAAQRVTVYNNQHLSAELADDVDAAEKAVDERVTVV